MEAAKQRDRGEKPAILKSPRGAFDILPPESSRWAGLESRARKLFMLFNYREVRTPVFEHTALFERSIGEHTDIVAKEMYTFRDRKERRLTLRPEGTAPIVRAYLEHNMAAPGNLVKLFYMGPFFRYERPQAGRNRQFYQLGAEALGSDNPALDAEAVHLSLLFLKSAGIANLRILLNSTGCPACRGAYIEKLRGYFTPLVEKMCGDCAKRLRDNPLRILDCKKTPCAGFKERAPRLTDYLCGACGEHFGSVRNFLDDSGIAFELNPFLVRGLDYYTRTTFEIIHEALGAQNAVAGGGRYDRLVEEFGGPPTPAVGFACGMERVLAASAEESGSRAGSPRIVVFAGAVESRHLKTAFRLVSALREAGIPCDMDYQDRTLKSQLKVADRTGAEYVVIVADELTLKNMATGGQEKLDAGRIIKKLKGKDCGRED